MADIDPAALAKVSEMMWDSYRKEIRKMGQRHRNVDRWLHDLGWSIPLAVLEKYLEPECLPAGNPDQKITIRRPERANG